MNRKVKIYTKPECDYCNKVKEFFNNNSIDFHEFDVTNKEMLAELNYKTGQVGVPYIFVVDQTERDDPTIIYEEVVRIKGFHEAKLKEIFNVK